MDSTGSPQDSRLYYGEQDENGIENNFAFDTPFGDLDLLGLLEPLGDYEAISKRAVTIPVGQIDLKVIHIDDLLAIQQYLQRPKDRESLMQLLAIKKIQSESP